jgi:hypothetical protein
VPKLKLKKLKPKAKPWYKSKTVWANVATIVAAMLTGLEQLLPVLTPVISASVMPWVLVGVGVLNIGLRMVTTEGIEGVAGTTG